MSATLKLTHKTIGVEVRRRTYDAMVDGKSAGSVELNETIDIPVEPGRHTLRVRHGRYSSRDRSFDVSDGEVAAFRCHGANIWPMYVASIVIPDLAITLKRE